MRSDINIRAPNGLANLLQIYLCLRISETGAAAPSSRLGGRLLQRRNVHPLEEAQSFRALLHLDEPK
jgi:hypothetical protein